MRPGILRASVLAAASILLTQTACHRGASSASFLNLFGLSKKPIVVALVARPDVLDPFSPHEKLRKAMSESLDCPVRLDLCLPIQLEANMQLGFYDVAIVTPACYVEMIGRDQYNILAAAVDDAGSSARPALLVTKADSDIQQVGDLRGKQVAFGPAGDARTNQAGLALLRENGLGKSDLRLSILPLPGLLRHYANAKDLALAVQTGEMDAGFIDEREFEKFAAQSETAEMPSLDKLRVIARTKPVPGLLVIQSPKAKPEVVRSVTEFLMTAGEKHPEALHPLLLSAYQAPTTDLCAWAEALTPPASNEAPLDK